MGKRRGHGEQDWPERRWDEGGLGIVITYEFSCILRVLQSRAVVSIKTEWIQWQLYKG